MYLEIKSRAKINLTLEVLYRRADGYHQLKTVMQELLLADTIIMEDREKSGVVLEADHPGLPPQENNLVFRAAELLREKYAPERGVRIRLQKNIPLAAGLGGGSSNAAAVLKGLERLWGLCLDEDILMVLAASLGSDVPFFLRGGTALAEGRGELLTSLAHFPRSKVLLASPRGMELSAGLVYNSLEPGKKGAGRKTDELVRFLQETEEEGRRSPLLPGLGSFLVNHLEEAVFGLEGRIKLLKERLLEKGFHALVSGSGPTVFAFSDREGKLLEAAEELSAEGFEVLLTETGPKGSR